MRAGVVHLDPLEKIPADRKAESHSQDGVQHSSQRSAYSQRMSEIGVTLV